MGSSRDRFFVTTNAPIAYGMFAVYFLAHPIMVILEGWFLRFALPVVRLPLYILSPIVLVLCVIGSYALNNIIENVWTFFIFGALGYLMVKTGFPLAPLILGVILGDQIETNYIRAVMTDSDWTLFFTRPWSGAMMALSVISFVYSLWQRRRAVSAQGRSPRRRRRTSTCDRPPALYDCIPALAITKKTSFYQKP